MRIFVWAKVAAWVFGVFCAAAVGIFSLSIAASDFVRADQVEIEDDDDDNCHEGCVGPPGPAGPAGPAGPQGPAGAAGSTSNANSGQSLAVNSALSLPGWLETGEQVSLSGGLGFAEGGETALGVTGILRINGGTSGFAGAAVSTEGGSWAGKVGVRVGW